MRALVVFSIAALVAHTAEGTSVRGRQRDLHSQHLRNDEVGVRSKYPFYHTSAALVDEAAALTSSCSGLTLDSEVDGAATLPVARVASVSSDNAQPLKVLMVFGEHARELISPETGLAFLKWLCTDDASQVRKRATFVMVLNANPQGRSLVEGGEYCTRTNENKVDLNRNYGFHWKAEHADDDETGVGSKQGQPVEAFSSGSEAFSEPETRIVARLINQTRPDVFLDVHSGTKGLFMPYDWTLEPIPNEADRQHMKSVLQEVNSKDCPECMVGDCAETVGYLAPGSSADYAYSQGVGFSFIWEIYADAADAQADARDQQAFLARKSGDVSSKSFLQMQDFASKMGSRQALSNHWASDLPQWALDDEAALKPMEIEAKQNCLVQFNPLSEDEYASTVARWSKAFVTLCNAVDRIRS
jgi:hypothetical protein